MEENSYYILGTTNGVNSFVPNLHCIYNLMQIFHTMKSEILMIIGQPPFY